METKELKVKIRRSFFDNYERPLHLHPEFIKFEDKDLVNNSTTIFKSSDIKEFRYGIHWYSYFFVFGREYQFYIRNFNNEVLKIRFVTYFGKRKKEYNMLYEKILDSLWDLYFRKQVEKFLSDFEKGECIQVGEVNINPEGIIIIISEITKQEKKIILWDNVRTHSYMTYFSIYSFENPREINRGYLYKEDWNTYVLYSIVRTILRNKNIEKY
ncbi:MAG: hypothetical protein B7Y83_16145 [Flavobacteriales bacterium 32-34-25]|nr:MAG: hypothetical protein B7Y83_16145 [Flavobacteriales bacterium 32-34-25]